MDQPSRDELMQQVINLTEKVSEVDKAHKSDVSKLIGEKECIAEALETSKKKVAEAEAQFDQMADLYKTVSVKKNPTKCQHAYSYLQSRFRPTRSC